VVKSRSGARRHRNGVNARAIVLLWRQDRLRANQPPASQRLQLLACLAHADQQIGVGWGYRRRNLCARQQSVLVIDDADQRHLGEDRATVDEENGAWSCLALALARFRARQ
jgi:hypothetical protein